VTGGSSRHGAEEEIMPASILVGYATRSGSTKEVAEAIVDTFVGRRLETELRPLRDVRSLDGYRMVVIGAPLYMFRWHNDALHFLSKHQKALKSIPVAIFALGPFHNKEEEMKSAREQLDKELAKVSWLAPVAVEVFPGKFDPNALRFPYNLMPPLKKMPPSDERDWDAIRSWASSLAVKL
jgi:menaquinone-dependent protoporphyrinogen oxidase